MTTKRQSESWPGSDDIVEAIRCCLTKGLAVPRSRALKKQPGFGLEYRAIRRRQPAQLCADHESLLARSAHQQIREFAQLCPRCAGIEGIIFQGARAFGLRHAPYRGSPDWRRIPEFTNSIDIGLKEIGSTVQSRICWIM
jgi:hypothetical protein